MQDVKIISGPLRQVREEVSITAASGWVLMGPIQSDGYRKRGDPAYPLFQTVIPYYIATMVRSVKADHLEGEEKDGG